MFCRGALLRGPVIRNEDFLCYLSFGPRHVCWASFLVFLSRLCLTSDLGEEEGPGLNGPHHLFRNSRCSPILAVLVVG